MVEIGSLSDPMAGSGLTGVEASGTDSLRDVLLINWSRNSSGGIAIRTWAAQLRNRALIPDKSIIHSVKTGSEAH